MPTVYDIAQQFRADLLARDDASRNRLLQAYWGVYRRLKADLDVLTLQIEEARAKGEIFSPSWLYRQERYQTLVNQVYKEITILSRGVAAEVEQRQGAEIARGLRDSATLMAAAARDGGLVGVNFAQLPATALEYLVGTLGDGSPLMKGLSALAPHAKEEVRRALVEGLAAGEGPRAMAARMRDALGGNADRAYLIARTESLRAYTEAQRESYRANQDILKPQWQWVCSLSARTCAACLALDGKIFELERPMPRHPACRCTTVPVLKGLPPLERTTGAQWFKAQPDAVKRQIIGKRGFELYQAGKVDLPDFVGERHSHDWGTSTFQRSLRQIEAGEAKPTWTRGQAAP